MTGWEEEDLAREVLLKIQVMEHFTAALQQRGGVGRRGEVGSGRQVARGEVGVGLGNLPQEPCRCRRSCRTSPPEHDKAGGEAERVGWCC